ncbi:5-formyltetrahydrofolate cyclo-ligase [Hazenella coriacea]|uniref:5-formyltetrahydrofolate cyclo-ligase n=1 Tax=Hazenella coriacea TaxID=1179467 RepID=UPI001404F3B5|nr:5-formyltetrahydrofolate cyclo-ligase [Hazenella coriacea]
MNLLNKDVIDLSEQKKNLRKKMLEKRTQFSPKRVQEHSTKISERIIQQSFYQQSQTILCYMAFRNEVDLRGVMEDAWAQGKQVLLPKVNPADRTMKCIQVKQMSDLQPGSYGIMEPLDDSTKVVPPTEIDLVLVPGVAFDLQGYRLGYGGGYYDRFFSPTSSTPIRVGVAFPEQVVSDVYPERHDQPMHFVITSTNVLRTVHRS